MVNNPLPEFFDKGLCRKENKVIFLRNISLLL